MTPTFKRTHRQAVLSDHKRIGKKFVPPMVAAIGKLSEVSWVEQIMPQVIWIALLIDAFGFKDGVDCSLAISRCSKESSDQSGIWFGWLSSFSSLSKDQRSAMIGCLEKQGVVEKIRHTFQSFSVLYPDFPLTFLVVDGKDADEQDAAKGIEDVKRILLDLYNRRSLFATRVQATVIYLAFVNDFLKVQRGLALADFPEIEKYPDTERSKEVAASIRATINLLAGEFQDSRFDSWSNYFWNRGLEIDACIVE